MLAFRAAVAVLGASSICLCVSIISACAASREAGDPAPSPGADAGTFEPSCTTPTTISGTAYAPAKADPDVLYNAVVYVPAGPLAPFPEAITCDRCGELPSDVARTSAITGPDGKFVLKNAPSGKDVSLVVQVGRWRRKVVVPEVKACQDNPLPADLTRLPRSQDEGDIPRMAIATAYIDPIECVLKKMGLANKAFSVPSGEGRIHFYQTKGEMGSDGATLGPGTPTADALTASLDALKKYDLVILPCEAREVRKDEAATDNLAQYAALGGRVFTTHYGYVWLDQNTAFARTARWQHHDPMNEPVPDPLVVSVDTSFPKGEAFASWLVNVNASPTTGVLQVREARHDVDGVEPALAQRWLSSDAPSTVQHLTFNTPIGAKPEEACGRVIYSNFHVVEDQQKPAGSLFPSECNDAPLSPQEKALEFMLLDLAACVRPDRPPK